MRACAAADHAAHAPAEPTTPIGSYLDFAPGLEQWLALSDIEHPALLPLQPPATTMFTLLVAGKLGSRALEAGETQTIVSKVEGESGWAVEYSFLDEPILEFRIFATRDSNQPVLARASFKRSQMPADGTFMFYARMTESGIVVYGPKGSDLSSQASFTPEALMVRQLANDARVTLGADPRGTMSYFEGRLQVVRAVAHQ